MTTKKFFTFEDISSADGTRYDVVEAHGGSWRIGTLSTADVVDWVERRKDPNGKVDASMFMLARSLVFGDPESGPVTRVPDEKVVEVMAQFKAKDDDENGKIVKACLKLNGMLKEDPAEPSTDVERGNASGEATSDASPTV